MKYAVFNPHKRPVEELPVIFGFDNGGQPGYRHGCVISQDGVWFAPHVSSNDGWMLYDLGILDGARFDRHILYQKHYPNGYRMDFVKYEDYEKREDLKAAVELAEGKNNDEN